MQVQFLSYTGHSSTQHGPQLCTGPRWPTAGHQRQSPCLGNIKGHDASSFQMVRKKNIYHVRTNKANTVKVLTVNMSVQCTLFAAIMEVWSYLKLKVTKYIGIKRYYWKSVMKIATDTKVARFARPELNPHVSPPPTTSTQRTRDVPNPSKQCG